ncbi:branched-chain amino acid aminotransferase [Aneurinibacillus migulanus]|uniref:branched-chain amino acid aminotransferase n=1 Tax=Aneurinibacillus migulanus TaxID=47500 RepID=UPI0005BC5F71|nr:branched-chain amino acid aminotransferase [Aneurinibacillus migulanus]KIV54329.1 branched-chain amino acid aminotransferase [Aneurinibacillus migulanus]KPD06721.1 branched-chain amino acid aminotransferase [Aneurinibacillus migulanus]MCP1354287.1 branched-chain amino acid aminotransferase [Aneurinibacillus migulanus]CEH29904.1 Branched-chain-amino-acid aminotransferase (EC 2. 6.1.42) [Aneurinibacillus migulanus]
MNYEIEVTLAESRKAKPNVNELAFGTCFTDHMFMMDYTPETGWHHPRIVPYAPISLDPAAVVFHYGQAVFEGMKAYRTKEDKILLFRPEKNMERLNLSNERLSIPPVNETFLVEAIKKLVSIEKEWVPADEGTSLYIRPFIIATEPYLGVRPARTYTFIVILSPVGAYYAEGINPVSIYVENNYVRAVKGGTGHTKTSGNYAASFKAQEEAQKHGCAQVLWLDGVEKAYIEEVGSMNVFFKVNGEVWTPALNGSILAGVTRDSVIQLLKEWNIPVKEKRISIEELYAAYTDGTLEEAFGTGTAAVISPIGSLKWNDKNLVINGGESGSLSMKIYDTICGIQTGEKEDPFGWTVEAE